MSVKQSLTSGTSEAARYLSFNPEGKDKAEGIIYKELWNNDLIDDTQNLDYIKYYDTSGEPIGDPNSLPCWAEFSVEAKLTLPWTITIPGLSPINLSITTDRQAGQIFCVP